MSNKDAKKLAFKPGQAGKSFTEERLTSYAGLTVLWDYLCSQGLGSELNRVFETTKANASRFCTAQLMLAVVLANLSGVRRLCRIATFTQDPLVSHLLGLPKGVDEDTFKVRLQSLGARGAHQLQELLFSFTKDWIAKCNLSKITIDCDSTEQTVYGHQQGAAKGYNPHKKGAKSYHPLLCFCTEMKLMVNSWFRTGSAYTSNGVCEFMQQTLAVLPGKVRKVFFRADSGFFNGRLFDLLEEKGHEYLVKVKLKNLQSLLKDQEWRALSSREAVCAFEYRAKDWKKARLFRAIRVVTGYVETDFFGKIVRTPQYDYFCYCSNLKNLDAKRLHRLYGARAETENWIEHAKHQLHACGTITDDFHVNDMLWQLAVLGYNLSVMMRYQADYKVWKQEPATFMRWFINVPCKVVSNARKVTVKMSSRYWYAPVWMKFAMLVPGSG